MEEITLTRKVDDERDEGARGASHSDDQEAMRHIGTVSKILEEPVWNRMVGPSNFILETVGGPARLRGLAAGRSKTMAV